MFLMAGCAPERLTEYVEGVVTLDGKPLADIRVMFEPKSSGSRNSGVGSYGVTDQQGHFVLRMSNSDVKGAVPGLHTVMLSDKRAELDDDAGPISVPLASRIPEKYLRSPLTYEVRLGEGKKAQFNLTSD
jgi:hypothetical protein